MRERGGNRLELHLDEATMDWLGRYSREMNISIYEGARCAIYLLQKTTVFIQDPAVRTNGRYREQELHEVDRQVDRRPPPKPPGPTLEEVERARAVLAAADADNAAPQYDDEFHTAAVAIEAVDIDQLVDSVADRAEASGRVRPANGGYVEPYVEPEPTIRPAAGHIAEGGVGARGLGQTVKRSVKDWRG